MSDVPIWQRDLGNRMPAGALVKYIADEITAFDREDWSKKHVISNIREAMGVVLSQDRSTNVAFTLVHFPTLQPSIFWVHTMLLTEVE